MEDYLQKNISNPNEAYSQGESLLCAGGDNGFLKDRFFPIPVLSILAGGSYLERGALFLGISIILLIIFVIFRLKTTKESEEE